MLRSLLRSRLFWLGAVLFGGTLMFALVAPWVLHIDIDTRVGLAYMPPTREHWLGTDHLGLDLVSLHVVGLRASFTWGFWRAWSPPWSEL